MLVTVSKEMKMSAAHQLPYHHGKCRNLHGHTFVVQLGVTGRVQDVDPANSESGMVADFGRVGAFLKDLHDTAFDHKLLNETMDACPTAERLVMRVAKLAKLELEPCLPEAAFVSHVRIYEEYVTPQCFAEAKFDGRGWGQGQ